MKPPIEELAEWLTNYSQTPLMERVLMMVPVGLAGGTRDPDAFVAWLRSTSAVYERGVVVMVVALVDHIFSAPSLNEDYSRWLDTEAAQQRGKFIDRRDRVMRETWASLRGGPLSTESIDQWEETKIKALLIAQMFPPKPT